MSKHLTVTQLGFIHVLRSINDPITSILLSIDMLKEKDGNPLEQRFYFDIIARNAALIGKSVEDMCTCFTDQQADAFAAEHLYNFPVH